MSFLRKAENHSGYSLDIREGIIICTDQNGKQALKVDIHIISHKSVENSCDVLKQMIELALSDLLLELNSDKNFMSNYSIKSENSK